MITIRDDNPHAEAFPNDEKYKKLNNKEWFVFETFSGDFPACKISDKHAILTNAAGKFINAYKYDNCLSIGSGHVIEYDTFAEAEAAIERGLADYL